MGVVKSEIDEVAGPITNAEDGELAFLIKRYGRRKRKDHHFLIL